MPTAPWTIGRPETNANVKWLIWSLALAPYGDAYARTHVAFFMSITVIGCVFCLVHLRRAAFALTLIVTVPFMITFMTSGNIVLCAIALNFGMVAVMMIVLQIRKLFRQEPRVVIVNQCNTAHDGGLGIFRSCADEAIPNQIAKSF